MSSAVDGAIDYHQNASLKQTERPVRYIEGILTGAPIWVWPLLVALIWLGLRSTKQRRVPVWLIFAMPLLALTSFGKVLALAAQPFGLHGYLAGYAIGALFGWIGQGGWLISKQGGFAEIRGEWFTLLAVMTIFWANFAQGVLGALAPEVLSVTLYPPVFASIIGIPGGFFMGRTLRTIATPRS